MLVIDVAVLVGLLGLSIFTASWVARRARKTEKADPVKQLESEIDKERRAGSLNAMRVSMANERKCAMCSSMTDPTHDVFVGDQWMHKQCYEDATN